MGGLTSQPALQELGALPVLLVAGRPARRYGHSTLEDTRHRDHRTLSNLEARGRGEYSARCCTLCLTAGLILNYLHASEERPGSEFELFTSRKLVKTIGC